MPVCSLSMITCTCIVRLCYSIRQLQLSEYTCRWENQIIGRSMSDPGMIGGAVPISTSGNRAISGWPLNVTSNKKPLPQHSRKMAYKEWDKATSLNVMYMVYMIITQTRYTMALLLTDILEERHPVLLLPVHGPGKKILSLRTMQKSDPIWWNVYMQE